MKKLILLFSLILLVCGFAAAQISVGRTFFVAARTLPLKSSAWFFAGTSATLEYGESVLVLQISGNWAEIRSVTSPSLSGWVSTTSLSARQITPDSNFLNEKEAAFKRRSNLNYADVDRIEALYINEAELYWFLEDGGLAKGKN